jgi:uncharacterized coiled-coil DUF342 family protein
MMKKARLMMCIAVTVCCMLIMFGCGKTADENRPLSEIKAEAAKMDADDLKAMALKYKEAIQAKLEGASDIKNELKEIPVTEMLGEKAKELKKELEPFTESINALKERFKVYYEELKKKGGDLSGLDL